MTGRLDMAGNNISNVSNPISNQDGAHKIAILIPLEHEAKSWNAMSRALSMSGNRITDVDNPTSAQDAIKRYYKIIPRTVGNSKSCGNQWY